MSVNARALQIKMLGCMLQAFPMLIYLDSEPLRETQGRQREHGYRACSFCVLMTGCTGGGVVKEKVRGLDALGKVESLQGG